MVKDARRYYTHLFNGTSGATPIVASAAIAINGVRAACGLPLASPLEMRRVLTSTGSPQSNISTGHIGPLPDIRAALASMPEVAQCRPQLKNMMGTASRQP